MSEYIKRFKEQRAEMEKIFKQVKNLKGFRSYLVNFGETEEQHFDQMGFIYDTEGVITELSILGIEALQEINTFVSSLKMDKEISFDGIEVLDSTCKPTFFVYFKGVHANNAILQLFLN